MNNMHQIGATDLAVQGRAAAAGYNTTPSPSKPLPAQEQRLHLANNKLGQIIEQNGMLLERLQGALPVRGIKGLDEKTTDTPGVQGILGDITQTISLILNRIEILGDQINSLDMLA